MVKCTGILSHFAFGNLMYTLKSNFELEKYPWVSNPIVGFALSPLGEKGGIKINNVH